jgi:hypothetical protein
MKPRAGRRTATIGRTKKATIEAAKLRKSLSAVSVAEFLPRHQAFRNAGKSLREIAHEMNRLEVMSTAGRALNPMIHRLFKTTKLKCTMSALVFCQIYAC